MRRSAVGSGVPDVVSVGGQERETAVMEKRCPCSIDEVDVYDPLVFAQLNVTIDHR